MGLDHNSSDNSFPTPHTSTRPSTKTSSPYNPLIDSTHDFFETHQSAPLPQPPTPQDVHLLTTALQPAILDPTVQPLGPGPLRHRPLSADSPTLPTLPTEILHYIFYTLNTSALDILHAVLTCKTLHYALLPPLRQRSAPSLLLSLVPHVHAPFAFHGGYSLLLSLGLLPKGLRPFGIPGSASGWDCGDGLLVLCLLLLLFLLLLLLLSSHLFTEIEEGAIPHLPAI